MLTGVKIILFHVMYNRVLCKNAVLDENVRKNWVINVYLSVIFSIAAFLAFHVSINSSAS